MLILEHAQVTIEFGQIMAKDLICFETWVHGPMSSVLPFQMLDMHQLVDMLDTSVSN